MAESGSKVMAIDIGQLQLLATPRFTPMKLASVQSASAEPDTQTIMNQHFHSVTTLVGK